MEVEMDLAKEKDWLPSSSSSPSSTVDWLGGKKLFWPLFWSYTDADSSEDSNSRSGVEETGEEEEEEDYSLDYGSEEPLPSGVGGDWDSRWNEGWDPMQSYYGMFCQVVHWLSASVATQTALFRYDFIKLITAFKKLPKCIFFASFTHAGMKECENGKYGNAITEFLMKQKTKQ